MQRRVVARHTYYESLAALGDSPEIVSAGMDLLMHVKRRPENGTLVAGNRRVRVVKSLGLGCSPPLRLFYALTEKKIILLSIECYDPLV